MAGIDFSRILIDFLVLIASLSVHEAAHAWSADRLGDPSPRLMGRVSLNPAVHVDPIGTLLFPLVGMLSGAMILGWAKPVQVNTMHLRGHWQRKFMMIAAAGPASNLVLATMAALIIRTVPTLPGLLAVVLITTVQQNVVLAVFNMVPLPPLDGGNVLSGLLRGSAATAFHRIRPYGFIILYGLMFSGMLSQVIVPPSRAILKALLPGLFV